MIFAVKKQENKITEGLGTFQKCLLEKKDEQSLLLIKGHAVTPTNTIPIRGIS